MGKNGSGKSTLCQVLAGRDAYEVTDGTVTLRRQGSARAFRRGTGAEGIFLAFQYPVEIPGVSTDYFLKAAVNAMRKHHGQAELDAMQFLKLFKERRNLLEIDNTLPDRAVNEGFSGGEKKRNEVFQMAVMNPRWGCWMRPIRAWTSTRSRPSPTASTSCISRTPNGPSCSSRTISGC